MKYIAFYDTPEFLSENRSVALCAANVSNYMFDVIQDFSSLEIISPSRTRNTKGFYHGRKTAISNKAILIQPPTFGVKTGLGRVLAIGFNLLWLLVYLLFHTKRRESVMVYHSLSIMMPIRIVKKIKGLELILEVREFYSDARQSYEEFGNDMSKLHRKEMKFFSLADKYVFPTELLNKRVNIDNKPYVIAPGIYKAEDYSKTEKWSDGKIHIVYAGTLREAKGVYDAIELVNYLPENYYVHILGSAPDERLQKVKQEIEAFDKLSSASISYDGQLRGSEFTAFLQKCHIGLSPQSKDASFNETSFPSKIFTYFSNGLTIVSVRIPAVVESPIGEYINYYDGTVEDLAKVVLQMPSIQQFDNKDVLDSLDRSLKEQMKKLVNC